MSKWAEYFRGEYTGWARQPDWPDWEDLIGLLKLECSADKNGGLKVKITSLEFGAWTGSLRLPNGILEGAAGKGNTYFKFAFEEMGRQKDDLPRFSGGIYAPPARLLLELRFRGAGRKPRPKTGVEAEK